MKKGIIGLVLVFVFAVSVHAQIKMGLHGGYTIGGDVEQGSGAFGGQIIYSFNDHLSLEVSGTKFSDQLDVLDLDVTHLAFTVRAEKSVISPDTHLYGGGGFSFNQFDVELDMPGISVNMDNAFGIHIAAGLRTKISPKVELFGEYRFTLLDTTALVKGPCSKEVVDGSYNFGIARIGVNFLF